MDCKLDASCKFKDYFCGRIIQMLKLMLVKVKAADYSDAAVNVTASAEDYNYGTKVLK